MGVKHSVAVSQARLDAQPSLGLAGANNSLSYRAEEIEKHFHSRERWLGIQVPQTATDWADDTLTPFVAISGADAYGSDANDEAQVLGADDTPIIAGMTKFDLHQIFILATDHDTVYKLRIVYGTGTMAAAITALQYTETCVKFDAANPQHSAGVPIPIMMPRANVDTKVWIQAWNATDDSEIDFLVGVHEYTA